MTAGTEAVSSRDERLWEAGGSLARWALGLGAIYFALVLVGEVWLMPDQGPALFWPAAGIPVAFGIVHGRRGALPMVAVVVVTEVAVRLVIDEPVWSRDSILVVAARLMTTGVAVTATDQVQTRYWHRPAIRTVAFNGAALLGALAGAPVACLRFGGQNFLTDCFVWAAADAVGIVVVGSVAIALLQLRRWQSAERWARAAGIGSLLGAGTAAGLAVVTNSAAFMLMAFPLLILAAALADVRSMLIALASILGLVAWSQTAGASGRLDLGTPTLAVAGAILVLVGVTTTVAGITLQHRFLANELAAIIDALPHFGATVDRNYRARRFMIPRELRDQSLGTRNGVSIDDYLHPDDIAKAHSAIDRALTGEATNLRVRVVVGTLGQRILDINVARVSRWRVLAISNDVTGTQELERERNWEAARYRSIASGLGEGLAEVDFETELVVYANQNWADAVGMPLDELIGQRLSAPLRGTMDTSEMARRLRSRRLEPFEFTYVHPDGSRRWILLRAVRSHHPDGGGSLLVLGNDITLLRETERRRLKIEDELTMVEQTERERFAKALHSSPIQMLTAVGLQLGAMQGSNPETSDELAELERVVGESIFELRQLIGSLIPPDASAGRIIQSLEHYVDRIGIDRERVTFSDETTLPPTGQTGIAAFGIAREALMNSLLHSNASNITVSLSESDDHHKIEVRDNGTGFDVDSSLGRSGHLGLRSLFEYASTVGGHCELNSSVRGTLVVANLPKRQTGRTSLAGPSIVVDRYATPSEFR